MLNEKANVTPSNAECDRVSPKYDKRRHTTKHPSGPVTIAIPIPAIKALTKKSSNIIWIYSHHCHVNDHDDVDSTIMFLSYVHQITLYILDFLQHYLVSQNNRYVHLNK